MTIEEIEQAIGGFIEELYCLKYNKKLKVEETLTWDRKHLGYLLKMDLNKPDKPFTIACEGDYKAFLDFVYKQLKVARLNTVDYFEGVECSINHKINEECNCK